MLLAWIWRFRPTLWHRGNVLMLIGLLLVGSTVALKVTAGRELLGYFLPTAAIGMVLAILLDASVATFVMAIIALIGGALAGSSLEFASYIFLGGMAGILAVRKGDRLQVFVQAGIAVFVVNALVVSVFSLLGTRDIRGVLELWFASGASAAGSAVAAVGTFAVLGLGVRHPDGVPAARARQPVPAPAAASPRRDAGHVPPLADGRAISRSGPPRPSVPTRWSRASPPTTTTSASSRTRWRSSRTRRVPRTSTTSSSPRSAPRS